MKNLLRKPSVLTALILSTSLLVFAAFSSVSDHLRMILPLYAPLAMGIMWGAIHFMILAEPVPRKTRLRICLYLCIIQIMVISFLMMSLPISTLVVIVPFTVLFIALQYLSINTFSWMYTTHSDLLVGFTAQGKVSSRAVRLTATTLITLLILLLLLKASLLLVAKPTERNTHSQASSSTPSITVQAPAMTPKETFMRMNAELGTVKTFADIERVNLKYGSKAQIAALETIRAEFDAMSVAQRDELLASFKLETLQFKEKTTIIQESINGSTATVSIRAASGLKNSVIFVLENNQWKVDREGA